MDPNLLAYVALLAWPLAALLLYRSLPAGQATLWTILGAELLLPVGTSIKLPMIPAIDKGSISSLSALLGCLLLVRKKRDRATGRSILVGILVAAYLASPVVTSVLNGDTIVVGGRVLPGVGAYDGISAVLSQLLVFLPFFLGRRYLRTESDTLDIMRVLVIAGLIYSVPMLMEVRLSPQLHTWFYGYFPHMFAQQVRADGFRPVVFMGHGLLVAFFSATTVIAAAALWRTRRRVAHLPPTGITAYLGGVLVLCKSAGALTYAAAIVPLVRLASPRLQAKVAVVLALIAVCYPVLRMTDIFPTAALLDVSSSFSSDRSDSLKFRFDNEDRLLQHASSRFWFGWGRYGRNRVYHEDTGDEATVTDGRWIITLGCFGFLGFLAEFGLLVLPIFAAAGALRKVSPRDHAMAMAAFALIMSIWVVDQLPNASLSPWTWLMAGALLGGAEASRARQGQSVAARPSEALSQAPAGAGFRFK